MLLELISDFESIKQFLNNFFMQSMKYKTFFFGTYNMQLFFKFKYNRRRNTKVIYILQRVSHCLACVHKCFKSFLICLQIVSRCRRREYFNKQMQKQFQYTPNFTKWAKVHDLVAVFFLPLNWLRVCFLF